MKSSYLIFQFGGAIVCGEERKLPFSAPDKTERNVTKRPLGAVKTCVQLVPLHMWVCLLLSLSSVSLQPHNRGIRTLCVVSPEPMDCGFTAKLQQHPAQGLIQQLGHPHSLLRATDILLALLWPLLHWLAHLLERNHQLFVPQPADQLHDPHFPQVTVITLLAQNTAVWQRQAADVASGPQLRLAGPLTHRQAAESGCLH